MTQPNKKKSPNRKQRPEVQIGFAVGRKTSDDAIISLINNWLAKELAHQIGRERLSKLTESNPSGVTAVVKEVQFSRVVGTQPPSGTKLRQPARLRSAGEYSKKKTLDQGVRSSQIGDPA
jgi:hypothetical protein